MDKANKDLPKNYCGQCYGGVPPENGCCNTCVEVEEAYTRKGWTIGDHDQIEQCVREGWTAKHESQMTEGTNLTSIVNL